MSRLLWYWLASCRVTYPQARSLLNRFGTLQELFEHAHALDAERIPQKAKQRLAARANTATLKEEMCALAQKGIEIVSLDDANYPALLREIFDPPLALYVRGRLERMSGLPFAVVGSRTPSVNGAKHARRIARELSDSGVTVVSGLARGIDTQANLGACEGKTPTVAVLGCGVDVVYPPENAALMERIAETGALVSEYLPGTRPYPGNFPMRNRIITGLCRGMLLVEGKVPSGGAITVDCALQQNRDVFALPGDVGLKTASLPNLLIQQGALVALGAQSILEYYGRQEQQKPQNQKKIRLDFLEQRLYNRLEQGTATAELFAAELDLPISQVNLTLTSLELKGIAERLPGNRFGLKIED